MRGVLVAILVNIISILADNYTTLFLLNLGYKETNPIKNAIPFEYWFLLDFAVLFIVFMLSYIICMLAGTKHHAFIRYWWLAPLIYGLARFIPVANNTILILKHFNILYPSSQPSF